MTDNTITARELIDLIISTKPEAEIENDEAMYARPHGEIEVDDEGLCTLVVHPDYGDSLDLGNYRFEVGGVDVVVSCDVDGHKDDFEFDGKTIVYEDGLTEEDVIKAIDENVQFEEPEETRYCETDFAPDDVEESISVEDDDTYAVDDEGNIYCYSDESEVPNDQTVLEASEAVHKLVEAWSENGGEVSDQFIESWGPWS